MLSVIKNDQTLKIAYFLFFFLLLFPKISIISIPGYNQGIRIEDLITLIILILILINYEKFNFFQNSGQTNFFLFVVYTFFSYLVGVYNNVSVEIFSIIRIFQYFTLLIFFSAFYINKNKIIKILKLIILFNLFIIILQRFEIIGYFSSRGYISPDVFGWQSTGIFSGSWELSFIISVCYFIIFEIQKKNLIVIFF